MSLVGPRQRRCSATELRLMALRGQLGLLLASGGSEQWATPSSKLVVFVSSTFTDTVKERNLLLEKILPELRERGRAMGASPPSVEIPASSAGYKRGIYKMWLGRDDRVPQPDRGSLQTSGLSTGVDADREPSAAAQCAYPAAALWHARAAPRHSAQQDLRGLRLASKAFSSSS